MERIFYYLYLLPQNLLQILLCLVINVEQSDNLLNITVKRNF